MSAGIWQVCGTWTPRVISKTIIFSINFNTQLNHARLTASYTVSHHGSGDSQHATTCW
jgi:hypothetical protein